VFGVVSQETGAGSLIVKQDLVSAFDPKRTLVAGTYIKLRRNDGSFVLAGYVGSANSDIGLREF
jgi:hypothetical protein